MPFRDAYGAVARQLQEGTFQPNEAAAPRVELEAPKAELQKARTWLAERRALLAETIGTIIYMAINEDARTLLAFSGGLDTSYCVLWLREQGREVHTVTVNTGGFDAAELQRIEKLAADLGADFASDD